MIPMRELVSYSIGGGWGEDRRTDGTEQVAIIRGADFPGVAVGDISTIPRRWESMRKLPQRTLQPGDIVLEGSGGTSDRPTGRTVFISEQLLDQFDVPVIPASFCRLVRIDPALADPHYVYWWLQGMYAEGRTWGYQNRSTGIANFQFQHFLDAEKVSLPNPDEQRAIATTLGALDDKIESNVQIVKLAWEIARAEWQAITAGGEPDRLGSMLELIYGKALPARLRTPGAVPVYGSSGVTGWHNEALMDGPGVIIGRKGTVGSVSWESGDYFPIDTTFIVEPLHDWPLIACYFAAQDARLSEMNSDSAVPGLNRDRALSAEVRLPTHADAQRWAQDVMPLIDLASTAGKEIAGLTELRDSLLPELLTGRISSAQENAE